MFKYFVIVPTTRTYIQSILRSFIFVVLIGLASSLSNNKATMGKAGAVNAMHWFRKGLRLSDNPALVACLEQAPKNV